MNREMLKRLTGSLLFRILILALILYVLYHIALALSDRILTDVVTEGVESVSYTGEGTLYRAETPLYLTANGALLSYRYDNGEKVNSASAVLDAVLLSASGAAYDSLSAQLDTIDTRIRSLEALTRLSSGDTLADLETLTAATEEQLNTLLTASTGGASFRQIDEKAASFLDGLNRVSALTDASASLPVLLANLRAKRLTILQSAGGILREVTLGELWSEAASGYFYHADAVDGYEAFFQPDALTEMTLADYESRKALALDSSPALTPGKVLCGKAATSATWYFALPLSGEACSALQVGNAYTLTFPDSEDATYVMTLTRLSADENGTLGIFSCNTLPKDFSLPRFSAVRLTVSTLQGLRIPSTALVTADGEEGVYILDGGRVCFRRITVLFRGEGYVLVYEPTAEERQNNADYNADVYIALRDIVITRGKDLFDGKYID